MIFYYHVFVPIMSTEFQHACSHRSTWTLAEEDTSHVLVGAAQAASEKLQRKWMGMNWTSHSLDQSSVFSHAVCEQGGFCDR